MLIRQPIVDLSDAIERLLIVVEIGSIKTERIARTKRPRDRQTRERINIRGNKCICPRYADGWQAEKFCRDLAIDFIAYD